MRKHWELIGNGEGVHWPELDEDLSVEGLLFGRPSGESQQSLQHWLKNVKNDLNSINMKSNKEEIGKSSISALFPRSRKTLPMATRPNTLIAPR